MAILKTKLFRSTILFEARGDFDNQNQGTFFAITFKLKIVNGQGAFSFFKDLGVAFDGRGSLLLILNPLFKLLMTF